MPLLIALVGRPNVGKSTLFNKLTRSRAALVADQPGLTRDRQYGDGQVGGFEYTVIDTGGLSDEREVLDSAMATQSAIAVDESDAVILLVDGKSGVTSLDVEIARELRGRCEHLILCVNKTDGVGEERALLDFYSLGIEPMVAIAAAHNRGVSAMMGQVAERLGVTVSPETRSRSYTPKVPLDPDAPIRIAFIGRPNVGKSTLINRLVGAERVIAYDKPGTTRDAVHIPFTRAGRNYTLVDTAGVRRRGKVSDRVEIFSVIKSMEAIDQSNVCIMMLDATDGVTDQDLHLIGYIIEKGRALVVAFNKWDALNAEQREAVRESLERRVEFLKFTRIHFISALKGSGVGDLFKSINRAWASASIDMSTPRLTRLLQMHVTQHQPPLVNGRRIKLRYAHQGGSNPPIIVIHGNQASKVPGDYQRYLSNAFMKSLKLFGTPLRMEFRQGENPYADKRSARRGRAEKR